MGAGNAPSIIRPVCAAGVSGETARPSCFCCCRETTWKWCRAGWNAGDLLSIASLNERARQETIEVKCRENKRKRFTGSRNWKKNQQTSTAPIASSTLSRDRATSSPSVWCISLYSSAAAAAGYIIILLRHSPLGWHDHVLLFFFFLPSSHFGDVTPSPRILWALLSILLLLSSATLRPAAGLKRC